MAPFLAKHYVATHEKVLAFKTFAKNGSPHAVLKKTTCIAVIHYHVHPTTHVLH